LCGCEGGKERERERGSESESESESESGGGVRGGRVKILQLTNHDESFLVRDKSLTHKFRIITAAKVGASIGPSETQKAGRERD